MAYYVVDHKVKNFGAWKKAYDAFQPNVVAKGIKDRFVMQSVDDPNHVVVIGEAPADTLRSFLASDELREAMKGAGVEGTPSVYIGENKA